MNTTEQRTTNKENTAATPKPDNFAQLLAELDHCVATFTSERSDELHHYLENVQLLCQAKDQVSKVLSNIAALKLETVAQNIVIAEENPNNIPHEKALAVFRMMLLAQVFREGFSPKLNQAVSALFSKPPAQTKPQKFATTLRSPIDTTAEEEYHEPEIPS